MKKSTLVATCNELQHLHLFVNLFNVTSAVPIYAWKQLCMMLSVSNACFAITMVAEHPVMAAFGVLVSSSVCVVFSVMYERAFFVTEVMQRAKLQLNMAITQASNIDRRTKTYMRKRVDSVPAVGIKLANFHKFERASTPSFLDFVIRNVAGYLLSRQL